MSDATPNREAPELDDTRALRADIYRLLARLIRAAPDQDLLGWLAGLEVADDEGELARHWHGLSEAACHGTPEALERAHFRHLVGVIQGDVTPYASWYRNGELMDEALLALRHDLKQLGFTRSESVCEPEDHLTALCEVMAHLVEARSADEAGFFMTHLAPWASRCLDDLARVETPFYARLGELGAAFINREHAYLADEASHDPVRFVTPDACYSGA